MALVEASAKRGRRKKPLLTFGGGVTGSRRDILSAYVWTFREILAADFGNAISGRPLPLILVASAI